MTSRALDRYPEIEGFEEELLKLSKHVVSKRIKSKQALYLAIAKYYGDQCGLKVEGKGTEPEVDSTLKANVIKALKEICRFYSTIEEAEDGDQQYVNIALISDHVAATFKACSIPIDVARELFARFNELTGLGNVMLQPSVTEYRHRSLVTDPAVEEQLEHLKKLPPGSFAEHDQEEI